MALRDSASCSTTIAQTVSPTPATAMSKKKNSSTLSRPRALSKRKMELRSLRKIQNARPDLNATDAITSAISLVPFLRLPQEIKNRIYELVLGGNLLHIQRHLIRFRRDVFNSSKGDIKVQRFTHQIYYSRIHKKAGQQYFDTADANNFFDKYFELRHSIYDRQCKDTIFDRFRLNISLLHTCRQIYNEARFLLYSANTFSFDAPRNLRAFIHLHIQRGVNVNQAFRSLSVDLTHVNHDLHRWTQAFTAVTRHMTRLQRVYITVVQRPNWSRSASPAQKEGSMIPVVDCPGIFDKTLAKSIMIVVSDHLSFEEARYRCYSGTPYPDNASLNCGGEVTVG